MDDDNASIDIWRTLRRGWKLVAMAVAGTAAIAGMISIALPDQYQATAVLTVETISSDPLTTSSNEINMNTERIVAMSTEVLERARQDLGNVTVTDLTDNLEVTVPKGSQALEFTYTANDAQLAADTANAIADAYSRRRVDIAETAVTEAVTALTQRIADAQTQLAGVSLNSDAYRALQLQITTLQERQASLSATTFSPTPLVTPAAAPTEPSNPPLLALVAAGAFLGLIGGFLGAMIFDRVLESRKLSRRSLVLGTVATQRPPMQTYFVPQEGTVAHRR